MPIRLKKHGPLPLIRHSDFPATLVFQSVSGLTFNLVTILRLRKINLKAAINYPAISGGVSEDRNGMIMPPHPDPLPQGERELWLQEPIDERPCSLSRKGKGNRLPRSKLRGIIRIEEEAKILERKTA